MAAQIDALFDENTKKAVLESKLLVVGAGGIGCELLKNLVLAGFQDIHVIDLDTIDVSNLNRQFLFRKCHVGKPKALVAKESVQAFNPNAKIIAYHDSITNPVYNVQFYQTFSAVLNALDNIAARKHVNRMCLAADIPLIESGSSGYLGNVTIHKKKISECYECEARTTPKNFPICTIRNTPSEPIHCIVWAKFLFNQLFGEEDAHEEVSPDTSEAEPKENNESNSSNSHNDTRCSTREWAKMCEYDAKSLFKKLFYEDIMYLLEMKNLWESRKPPSPLDWDNLPDAVESSSRNVAVVLKDQAVWSIKECAAVFKNSLETLKKKLESSSSSGPLVWDKDDDQCMDFVAACTNLRAYCFKISQECRFKIKSMAGNIIPAIATTNAIVAGLIVLQLFKIIVGQIEKCHMVVLNKAVSSSRKRILASYALFPPKPDCFVCSPNAHEVHVKLNANTVIVKTLQEKILIGHLNMVEPDVIFDDGKGTMLISSDPTEMEGLTDKVLDNFGIKFGSRLQCDDYFQNFKLVLVVDHDPSLVDQDFFVVSDLSLVKPKEDEGQEESVSNKAASSSSNIPDDGSDDDVAYVMTDNFSLKRKLSDDENGIVPKKRIRKHSETVHEDEDEEDIVVL